MHVACASGLSLDPASQVSPRLSSFTPSPCHEAPLWQSRILQATIRHRGFPPLSTEGGTDDRRPAPTAVAATDDPSDARRLSRPQRADAVRPGATGLDAARQAADARLPDRSQDRPSVPTTD